MTHQAAKDLRQTVKSLLSASDDFIANAANLSSILYQSIDKLNWVGFYFVSNERLLLGPFCGKPACVWLNKNKGVCWAAINNNSSLKVDDVLEFPGHIACDSESRSELVVPLFHENIAIGVLDIDSPIENRFNEIDLEFFDFCAREYLKSIDIDKLIEHYQIAR